MTLAEWLKKHGPATGSRAWLMRASGASFATIRLALSGVPIGRVAAEKLSAVTDGRVSVADLMRLDIPRRRKAS